jgi:arginine/lysine/histidine transport system permease protein
MDWFQSAGDKLYNAFIEKDRYLAYISGFKITLFISFFAVIVGVFIGLIIAIIKYTSAHKNKKKLLMIVLEGVSNIYIAVIRGTPVYVQLLILYYIVFTSRGSSPLVAGIICFGINSSAYVAEIIRAGIEAVDKGQMEAGKSLGLSSIQTMIFIILPQAIKNILPALGNEFIVLIKETAIIGVMAVKDVTRVAQNVGGITYDLLTPLIITAIMYFIVVVILTKLLSMFERRLAQSD